MKKTQKIAAVFLLTTCAQFYAQANTFSVDGNVGTGVPPPDKTLVVSNTLSGSAPLQSIQSSSFNAP